MLIDTKPSIDAVTSTYNSIICYTKYLRLVNLMYHTYVYLCVLIEQMADNNIEYECTYRCSM
eukprot:SAG31_NODE_7269_length_1737_cov_1.851038_1_plen_62_part_00